MVPQPILRFCIIQRILSIPLKKCVHYALLKIKWSCLTASVNFFHPSEKVVSFISSIFCQGPKMALKYSIYPRPHLFLSKLIDFLFLEEKRRAMCKITQMKKSNLYIQGKIDVSFRMSKLYLNLLKP